MTGDDEAKEEAAEVRRAVNATLYLLIAGSLTLVALFALLSSI